MSILGLAACSASVPAPMPLAASGPSEVTVDGAAYMADLQPVSGGAQLSVQKQGGSFALDEGLLAKGAALRFCVNRGQALDPAALGAFAGGLWVFDGGCV